MPGVFKRLTAEAESLNQNIPKLTSKPIINPKPLNPTQFNQVAAAEEAVDRDPGLRIMQVHCQNTSAVLRTRIPFRVLFMMVPYDLGDLARGPNLVNYPPEKHFGRLRPWFWRSRIWVSVLVASALGLYDTVHGSGLGVGEGFRL